MIRALHRNDILLLGSVSCQLDGRFHSFRAGIPKEESIQRLVRHDRKKLLDQFNVRLLECDIDLAMNELAGLFLCRLGHSRMAMAQVRNADAAGEVQVFAAAHHGDIAARAALDDFIC